MIINADKTGVDSTQADDPRITMAFDLTLLNNVVQFDTDAKQLPML